MSTSITTAFITAYEAQVHDVFQRRGSFLRPAVRIKDNVVGSTAVFQKIGTGVATTKARHGAITPMNQTHTAPSATLADFYAGDWVDKLDEAKTNIDERDALARGGAFALGRKVDDQILVALDATTQTTITLTMTNSGTIQATVLEFIEALDSNDVPNGGQRYGVISPRYWAQLMNVDAFASADYVGPNGLPFTQGAPMMERWKSYLNVMWKVHSGVPGVGTTTSKVFAFHKTAIGYASAASAGNVAGNGPVGADITWHGDRAAHFVNHMMSGGAVLIDDTGVIEANLDDQAAIATS